MQKKLNGVSYRGANNILTKELSYQEYTERVNGERPIRLFALIQRSLLPVYKLRVHRLCYTAMTGAELTFHSGLA